MKSLFPALVRILVVGCAFILPAFAQQNPNLEQGLKPYGMYQGGNLDSISITNRNLTLHIPIVSYPQRGGKLRLNFMGIYNNKGWAVEEYVSQGQTYKRWIWKGAGVQIVNDQSIRVKGTILRMKNAYGDTVLVNLRDAITADGSSHQLEGANGGLESVDASGILHLPGSSMVIDRDGIRFTGTPTSAAEDPNGNKITINTATGWTDTLGRFLAGSIPTNNAYGNYPFTNGMMVPGVATTDYTNCPTGTVAARIWNLPGPNGGTSPIKLCYASYSLQPSFGIPGIQEPGPVTDRFIRAVVLPNLTSWLFQYNSFGDLTQVTLPTGGTISYVWNTANICSSSLQFTSRVVTSRTLDANDGTGPKTWNYPAPGAFTDPLGNNTVNVLSDLDGACSYYVTETRSYQGSSTSGTLLKTVSTSYSWISNPRIIYADAPAINVVATTSTTTWPNGKKGQSTTTYDSGNTFSFYDAINDIWTNYPLVYGSVMQATESDYGNPNPGPVLRQTISTYLWTSDANYKSRNMLNLVSSTTVKDGAGTQIGRTELLYDQTTPQSSGITMQHNSSPSGTCTANPGQCRGNTTSVRRWLNADGTYPTTVASFYDTGMPYQTTDPGNHLTTFSYSSSFYGAYVTQTQFPDTNSPNLAHHSISGNYDFNSGLLTSFTDENGNTSTYAYDIMWRITSAVFPPQNGLNGQTNFYYPDVLTVERQQKIDSTRWTDLFVRFDGLGREIRRITANDESTPWDQVDTCYNNRGEQSFGSYPYQGTGLSAPQVCTGAGDSFTYDALGRVTRVTHSDATYVQSDYTGPATQVTDEGNGTRGVQRISQVDGLGRLTNVCEVTSTALIGITPTPAACGLDIAATGFLTSYSYAYDPTSKNLTFTVQQGGLNPRTAVYDSLSRLTSSTNPEAGTISYGYDPDGLLTSRLAPRPNQTDPSVKVTTNYTYDELHRPRTRTYVNDTTGTPAATFNYDEASAFGVTLSNSLGRQSSVFVVNGQSQTLSAEVFSYDSMGRVLVNSQCTQQNCPSTTFPIVYTYDLIGGTLTGTNGLGVTLTYAYNRAARLTTLTSNLSDANHPGTLVSGVHYNAFGGQTTASLGSGVSESLGYTARGWLQSVGATLGGNGVYSFSLTFAGNGNALTGNDSVNGNWTYGYDDFNRLASANKNSGQEVYTYDYDRFGNRWHQNGPNLSSLGFDANNRITGSGVTYDAAGNVTNDGQNTYTYDAENRIISESGPYGTGTYVYSAAGLRIRRTTGSGTVDYLCDLAGHAVTEVNTSGAWTRSEVYAGSRHVATYKDGPTGTTYFSHTDWLGTERVRTDKAGMTVESCTSLPFGDAQTCTGTSTSPLHFTGKERDTESDNDYFGARYYISRQARWLTTDSSTVSVVLVRPQSLNRYSYALNNPIANIDPNGKWTTGIHDLIINEAFYFLSGYERNVLKFSSEDVDRDQSKEGAHKHGMSKPGQKKESAEADAGDFVDKNIQEAVDEQLKWEAQGNTGNSDTALWLFGQAVHTVTDEYSPEHSGFQAWHGLRGNPANWARAGAHAVSEFVSGHFSTDDNLEAQHNARVAAYLLWRRYQEALEQARKEAALALAASSVQKQPPQKP